jgi:hypothetical protein
MDPPQGPPVFYYSYFDTHGDQGEDNPDNPEWYDEIHPEYDYPIYDINDESAGPLQEGKSKFFLRVKIETCASVDPVQRV